MLSGTFQKCQSQISVCSDYFESQMSETQSVQNLTQESLGLYSCYLEQTQQSSNFSDKPTSNFLRQAYGIFLNRVNTIEKHLFKILPSSWQNHILGIVYAEIVSPYLSNLATLYYDYSNVLA